MLKPYYLLPFAVGLGLAGFAQTKDEVLSLEPGQVVEREIAGGQSHTYQVDVQAGQFARFVVEQKGVNVTLALIGPDGALAIERKITNGGGRESLSYVAIREGRRQLVVQAASPNAAAGAYLMSL